MRRLIFLIALLAGLTALQSCKTTQSAIYTEPIIGTADFDYWIHSPLHPDNNQAVTFKSKIGDKEGVLKVELLVYEYELYENGDGLPSKRRRNNGQWGLVYDWEFDGSTTTESIDFTFAKGFKAFSNIEYIFRVFNTKGEVSERLAIFDAGDAKWPLDKITLYATTRNPLAKSINLCLFPDTDYQQDWRGFLTDMEGVIFDGFHQNNQIKNHKENWQYYYTQREADGYNISKNFYEEDAFPSFVKNAEIQGIDAYGLMHKEPYSDGAYLKNNIHFLSYNIFTSESYNYGTAIHESAHAIFNLSDEYDLCACFEHPEGANMFSSLKGCQSFNRENGFPISDCSPIEHLNGESWYMSEPSVMFTSEEQCQEYNAKNGHEGGECERFKDYDGSIYYRAIGGLCIMQDDGDAVVRDFQRTCSRVIDNYYEKLNREDEEILSASLSEDIENIYGYQPVVVMEMIHQKEQLGFKVKGIQHGVPKKNIMQRDAIQLDFIKTTGDKYSISLPDPTHLHIHTEHDDEVVDVPNVNYQFMVPYTEDLQTMVCAQKNAKHGTLMAKGGEVNKMEITNMDLLEPLKQVRNVVSEKR